jgi:hypothetical protein
MKSTLILTGIVGAALISGTMALADSVEITLADDLEGILNGFCLDVAGGNENADPANGLQAHTCYSYRGSLGTDQTFDTAKFVDNTLYMPEYDVCAAAASTAAGTEIALAVCDGSAEQAFVFSGEGAITPASAPDMCFTASDESRFGRGSQHQIRDLTLEACSDELASRQQWRTRMTDD